MEHSDYRIGQRVIAVLPVAGYDSLVGKTGTIVHISELYPSIGVEFDIPFDGGHSCGGYSRDFHGRYGNPECFKPYFEMDDSPVEISLSLDELFQSS